MSDPVSITEWLQRLPIGWLAGRTYGRADVTSYGTVIDGQVDMVAEATRARMPNECAADALPYIGLDRRLIQGTGESEDSFRTRLQTAWDDWARAGTALELLVQLFFNGFYDCTLVQQNGLYYQLSGDPVAGEDPTSLLVVGDLAPLAADLNPLPSPPYSKVIPAGTPWWMFDQKTDFCSRFALIFAGPRWPAAFTQSARVTFAAATSGTATWANGPFTDTAYEIMVGAPVITSGGPAYITADPASKTRASIDLDASASFTGYVDVYAWKTGDNPFVNLLPSDLGRLRSIVQTWRPAKATWVAAYAVVSGSIWGLPGVEWGDAGLLWGASSVEFLPS